MPTKKRTIIQLQKQPEPLTHEILVRANLKEPITGRPIYSLTEIKDILGISMKKVRKDTFVPGKKRGHAINAEEIQRLHQLRDMAGRINPTTGKPFTNEELSGGYGVTTRAAVHSRLKRTGIKKKDTRFAKVFGEKRKTVIKLAKKRDPVTGEYYFSPRDISKKTGVSEKDVKNIIQESIKGTRYRSIKGKTKEIVRLASIHDIGTKRPLYPLREIAEIVGRKTSIVSKTVGKYNIERNRKYPAKRQFHK